MAQEIWHVFIKCFFLKGTMTSIRQQFICSAHQIEISIPSHAPAHVLVILSSRN